MPAMMLPHGCEGLRVRRRTVLWTFRRPFMGRPVPRQLLRNALLDLTTIVPVTAYHRRSYTRDTVGIAKGPFIRHQDHGPCAQLPIDGYRREAKGSIANVWLSWTMPIGTD